MSCSCGQNREDLSAPMTGIGVRFAQSRNYIIPMTRRTGLRADGYAVVPTSAKQC